MPSPICTSPTFFKNTPRQGISCTPFPTPDCVPSETEPSGSQPRPSGMFPLLTSVTPPLWTCFFFLKKLLKHHLLTTTYNLLSVKSIYSRALFQLYHDHLPKKKTFRQYVCVFCAFRSKYKVFHKL